MMATYATLLTIMTSIMTIGITRIYTRIGNARDLKITTSRGAYFNTLDIHVYEKTTPLIYTFNLPIKTDRRLFSDIKLNIDKCMGPLIGKDFVLLFCRPSLKPILLSQFLGNPNLKSFTTVSNLFFPIPYNPRIGASRWNKRFSWEMKIISAYGPEFKNGIFVKIWSK